MWWLTCAVWTISLPTYWNHDISNNMTIISRNCDNCFLIYRKLRDFILSMQLHSSSNAHEAQRHILSTHLTHDVSDLVLPNLLICVRWAILRHWILCDLIHVASTSFYLTVPVRRATPSLSWQLFQFHKLTPLRRLVLSLSKSARFHWFYMACLSSKPFHPTRETASTSHQQIDVSAYKNDRLCVIYVSFRLLVVSRLPLS